MKSRILVAIAIFGVVLFTSCEPQNLADEEIIELQSTDKKDSVNSGGGPNPTIDNDEE